MSHLENSTGKLASMPVQDGISFSAEISTDYAGLQELETRLAAAAALVDPEANDIMIGVANTEAFVNAKYHGNCGYGSKEFAEMKDNSTLPEDKDLPPAAKKKKMSIGVEVGRIERQDFSRERYNPSTEAVETITKQGCNLMFRLMIEDEGGGFSYEDVPDPRETDQLEETSGRGLVLMKHVYDEVFHSNGGRRAVLTLLGSSGDPEEAMQQVRSYIKTNLSGFDKDNPKGVCGVER